NISGLGNVGCDGGGRVGADLVQMVGTTETDLFSVSPFDALNGSFTLNDSPIIGYGALGSAGSMIQFLGSPNGGAGENDSIQFAGTPFADTYAYTPNSTYGGTLTLTSGVDMLEFDLFSFAQLTVDAAGQFGGSSDVLNVTVPNAVVTPGATPGSGNIAAKNAFGGDLLPLDYRNVENVTVA